jgi:hypothetical protein
MTLGFLNTGSLGTFPQDRIIIYSFPFDEGPLMVNTSLGFYEYTFVDHCYVNILILPIIF